MPVISTIAAATARAFGAFKSAAGGAADEFFNYVTLLLHGDGTNGAQNNTFLDSSTNNFTITRNGNTTQGTFSPFSQTGWSNYFDGSGDYLSVAHNAAMSVLGSSFTMECWFYLTAAQRDAGLISKHDGSGGYIFRLDTTFIRFFTSAATVDRTYSFAANTWYHVAVVSSGTTGTLYINGVAQGATFSTNGTNASSTVQIGRTNTTTNDFPGYISEVRITNTAVYTGTFTPPSAPLTAVTGTALLCNFTNGGIIDNTAKNVLETVGNAQISTSVKKFGTGSLAFDGTGDNLRIPNSQNYAFGSGNWTIELWVYLNALGRQGFVTLANSSGTNVPWEVGLNASNKFRVLVQTSGGQIVIDGATTPSTSTWYHIAAVRNNGTVTLYLNGTSDASNSTLSTNALVAETNSVNVGTYAYGYPLNGYIDDLRITKGVARYTTTFTPPTAAFGDQ